MFLFFRLTFAKIAAKFCRVGRKNLRKFLRRMGLRTVRSGVRSVSWECDFRPAPGFQGLGEGHTMCEVQFAAGTLPVAKETAHGAVNTVSHSNTYEGGITMSEVITNAEVVNSSMASMEAQMQEVVELTEEQLAETQAEAKKELGLVVKALKAGNRETAVSQYLAGLHGLKFVNLCRKGGKARSWAIGELQRELGWWMANTDVNLILRTYGAISLLHGDIQPPGKDGDKKAWSALVEELPPVGHFHSAYAQLVERQDNGREDTFVLLPGFEERVKAVYAKCASTKLRLKDTKEEGKVVEKGVETVCREVVVEYMRWKADRKAAEAAERAKVSEEAMEEAKGLEDKATQQQAVVKSLLETAAKAEPEDKAKLEAEAKKAMDVLQDYRKELRQMVEIASTEAKEARLAQQEALESEKKADKGSAKLEKRRSVEDTGRVLPWQAQGENAASQATVKDLAEALYGIVSKHAEPEDVLYAMLMAHRKDGSKQFQAALAGFAQMWIKEERKAAAVA